MRTKYLIIPTAIALVATPGCVTHTTFKNEARQSVHFSSGQAAETFYEAYLAASYPSDQRNMTAFWIGLPYTQRKISTENVYFNRAVQSADSNHDGIISDAEAQDYAAKLPKHSTAHL
jgi:hypothetical protein